jgi:hypothetical protein
MSYLHAIRKKSNRLTYFETRSNWPSRVTAQENCVGFLPVHNHSRKATGSISSEARKNENASIGAVDWRHGILTIMFLIQSVMYQSYMQFDRNIENASINVFLCYFNMLSMLRVIKKILLM